MIRTVQSWAVCPGCSGEILPAQAQKLLSGAGWDVCCPLQVAGLYIKMPGAAHTRCRCEQQMLFMELQWAEDTGGWLQGGLEMRGGIGPLHDLPESTGPSGGEVCRA